VPKRGKLHSLLETPRRGSAYQPHSRPKCPRLFSATSPTRRNRPTAEWSRSSHSSPRITLSCQPIFTTSVSKVAVRALQLQVPFHTADSLAGCVGKREQVLHLVLPLVAERRLQSILLSTPVREQLQSLTTSLLLARICLSVRVSGKMYCIVPSNAKHVQSTDGLTPTQQKLQVELQLLYGKFSFRS